MTYNGKHPKVKFIEKVYETGIKLTPKIMKIYESALKRKAEIERWFVIITSSKSIEIATAYNLLE